MYAGGRDSNPYGPGPDQRGSTRFQIESVYRFRHPGVTVVIATEMRNRYRPVISAYTRAMPHPGNKIHIPLKEGEAIKLFAKVKPTAEMPRPGAQPTKPKKKPAKKRG